MVGEGALRRIRCVVDTASHRRREDALRYASAPPAARPARKYAMHPRTTDRLHATHVRERHYPSFVRSGKGVSADEPDHPAVPIFS